MQGIDGWKELRDDSSGVFETEKKKHDRPLSSPKAGWEVRILKLDVHMTTKKKKKSHFFLFGQISHNSAMLLILTSGRSVQYQVETFSLLFIFFLFVYFRLTVVKLE